MSSLGSFAYFKNLSDQYLCHKRSYLKIVTGILFWGDCGLNLIASHTDYLCFKMASIGKMRFSSYYHLNIFGYLNAKL